MPVLLEEDSVGRLRIAPFVRTVERTMNDRMNMAPAQSAMADRWNANAAAAESRGLPARDSPQPPKGRWERPRGAMAAAMDPVLEQLSYLRGPTSGLETRTVEPKKFTGRCRLFVGNLPNNFTEEQFRKLFENYGEVAEIFLNTAKGFGFVKLVCLKMASNGVLRLCAVRRSV